MPRRHLLIIAGALLTAMPAVAQTYRNVLNAPYQTVSNGPMSAIIVDAPRTSRAPAVQEAVAAAVRSERSRRDPGVLTYLAALRRQGLISERSSPGIPDIVLLRQNGQPIYPDHRGSGTTRAGGAGLTFAFPTAGAPGAWTPAWEADLRAVVNILYDELRAVYGEPSWSGTVTILNGDNMTPIISDPNALSGGLYNVSTQEIVFQQNLSAQSAVLNLAQMMALAFRGSATISYDAWERGMARAAAVMTVRNALSALKGVPSQVFGGTLGDLDVYDPLWQALDRYDWLNQPALANDRFFPVSRKDAVANQAGWPNMLVPRLQMAGTAWLKVLVETPGFLARFNADYYAALASNPSLRNNVPGLAGVAVQSLAALGGGTVEGQPFGDWYRRQHALDTSVSLGPKVYAQVSPLRPDPGQDDFGLGVILLYYRTAMASGGVSDEIDLNATVYPIYRDYTLANRLFIGAQYEQVDIRSGIGSVAPTFFNTIGGDAGQEGRMRITMDFPIASEGLRLETAPRSSGRIGSPNNFWGVVVGADAGTIQIEADGRASGPIPVAQGAFGTAVDAELFSKPRRAILTFTPPAGDPVVRQMVTGVGEQVVVFSVVGGADERIHAFPAGPTMVSFPIQPLKQRVVEALLDPANGTPLFRDTNLLMARWRQSLAGEDKYARYPNMEPIAPGKGYWLSLEAPTDIKIVGRLASRDRDVTVGLLYGWNQIGNPYETAVQTSSLLFQYKADNVPVNLATAISRGWIVAQSIPGVGEASVWGHSAQSGYYPAQTLEPWAGYWIRVLVSEGVTLTYPTPGAAASAKRSPKPTRSAERGWSVAFTVADGAGRGSTAYIGQTTGATSGVDAAWDAEAPPSAAGPLPEVRVSPSGVPEGRYISDIRGSGSRSAWRLVVQTPRPEETYTLTWNVPGSLPRTTRLCLVDTASGRRQYLHASSSLTFNSGRAATRVFEVLPEERGPNACRLLNPRITPSRATGIVRLTVDITSAATITASVVGSSGRPVRKLERGRAAQPGDVTLLWDGRDDRGIAVPAGVYTLVINARTDQSDSARLAVPVVITR